MSRGWRRSSSRKAPSPYVDHMLHHTSGRFPAQEGHPAVDAAAKARHPAGRAALRIAVVQDQEMLQLQLAQGILLGMAREFAVKPTTAPISFGLNAECNIYSMYGHAPVAALRSNSLTVLWEGCYAECVATPPIREGCHAGRVATPPLREGLPRRPRGNSAP